MAFPLAAVLAPLAIQVGGSLLSKFIGGKPKESQASVEAGKKAASERALLDNRLRILGELEQNKGTFTTIMGKNGKPFVMRLPGPGGISGEKFTSKLRHLMGAIDFGKAKDIQLLQSIAGLSSAGSNTSGVAVQGAADAQARSDQNAQGIASMLGDVGSNIFGQTRAGGGPGLFPGDGPVIPEGLDPGIIQDPTQSGSQPPVADIASLMGDV